jgi:hypothetical protein
VTPTAEQHLHKWRQAGKQSTSNPLQEQNTPSTLCIINPLVKSPSISGTSNILVARDELLSCKSMKLSRQIRETMKKKLDLYSGLEN